MSIQPPSGPLKQPKPPVAHYRTIAVTIAVVSIALSFLFGAQILNGPLLSSVRHAIFHATPTPNPITAQLVPSAVPSPSASSAGSALSFLGKAFSHTPAPHGPAGLPHVGNAGAVAAGLATPTPTAQATPAPQPTLSNRDRSDFQTILNQLNGTGKTPSFGSAPQYNPLRPLTGSGAPAAGGGTVTYPTLSTPGASPAPSSTPFQSPYIGLAAPGSGGVTLMSPAELQSANQAAFLDTGTQSLYDPNSEAPPRYRYVVFPNDPLFCRLSTTIDTTLPGAVYAIITRDVRGHDLARHNHHPILIPALSMLYGTYNDNVAQGDNRIQVRWNAIILPNGYTIPLKSVQASAANGTSGMPAEVNNHVGRVYTSTFLGILGAGISALAGSGLSLLNSNSPRALFLGGAAQQASSSASSALSTQQQQPPTLVVRSGTLFQVHFAAIEPLTPYNLLLAKSPHRLWAQGAQQ